MPAVSKSQYRIMKIAYDYKTGKIKNCPKKIKKIADSMTLNDLEDFINVNPNELPEKKIKESVTFEVHNRNSVIMNMLKDWLDSKNINYIENGNNFEVLNSYDLDQDDQLKFMTYITKSGMKKINEDCGQPATLSTLGNTIGLKYVNPPTQNSIGSGDRFDNTIPPTKKKLKKNDIDHIQRLNDFIKKKKRI